MVSIGHTRTPLVAAICNQTATTAAALRAAPSIIDEIVVRRQSVSGSCMHKRDLMVPSRALEDLERGSISIVEAGHGPFNRNAIGLRRRELHPS